MGKNPAKYDCICKLSKENYRDVLLSTETNSGVNYISVSMNGRFFVVKNVKAV